MHKINKYLFGGGYGAQKWSYWERSSGPLGMLVEAACPLALQ
jgi:hypothetical protein